ncbi:MAG: type II methionyl aminopeptidase [Planctomycetota bacterium]
MPALTRPALDPLAAEKFRQAGRVAGEARRIGASLIRPGTPLREVMEAVEAFIYSQDALPAFPAQTSRNHIAAHYCPHPGDTTVYQEGDMVKIDIGAAVDGFVGDTAETIYLGTEPVYQRLVDASRNALSAAIRAAGPGIRVNDISAAIEKEIDGLGFCPVYNLTGHGVDRWKVHTAPQIPPSPDPYSDIQLQPGMVIAIEPFATDGRGQVYEKGRAEVFMIVRNPRRMKGVDPAFWEVVEGMNGLPFARRTFPACIPRDVVENSLARLIRMGSLMAFAPLVDPDPAVRISQCEHTLLITEDGAEVLTGVS